MARVTISRYWGDHDKVTVQVDAATSYPDALAEAKRVALDAFAEAHAAVMDREAVGEDGE